MGPVESIINEDVNKMLRSPKLPNRGYQISEIMIQTEDGERYKKK